MPMTHSSKMRTSSAEALLDSGWNCVPSTHQSSRLLSMASITPSGRAGADHQAWGHFINRHVMHAVHTNFAVAKDPFHQRARHHFQTVAVRRIDRIGMRDGLRTIFRNVQNRFPP